MTREEAIQYLTDTGISSEHIMELVEALTQEPCADAISRQAMHIELEKWITYGEYKYTNATKYLYDRIDRLPPVTPAEKQEPREDVSDINDGNIYECPCGYGWDKSKVVRHHFCPNCGRAVDSTEQEPCDAVSRKEVMNMLHNHAFDYATSTKILALIKTMCGEVDRMPSVTPQYTEAEIQRMQELEQAEIQKAYELGKADAEKVGQWIDIQYFKSDDTYYRPKCPFCNTEPKEYSNYCPNCGAKMQEVME